MSEVASHLANDRPNKIGAMTLDYEQVGVWVDGEFIPYAELNAAFEAMQSAVAAAKTV